MSKDFDYKDLVDRGDLAVDLIRTVLQELDLLIAFSEDKETGVREVIFADKTAYLKEDSEKHSVSTEIKVLNATIFDSIDKVPKHLRDRAEMLIMKD